MSKLSAAAKEAEKYLRRLKNTKKARDYNRQDPETMKEVLKGSKSKNYNPATKEGSKRLERLKMGQHYGKLKGGEKATANKPKDMRSRKEMSNAQLDKEIKLMDKDLTMDERAALLGGYKKGGKVKKGYHKMPDGRIMKDSAHKGMKKGGKVSSCSKRADGCAVKGKTKGRIV